MSWFIFGFIYFGRVRWLLGSVWKGGGRGWLSTSSLTAPSGLVTSCQFRLHLNLTSLPSLHSTFFQPSTISSVLAVPLHRACQFSFPYYFQSLLIVPCQLQTFFNLILLPHFFRVPMLSPEKPNIHSHMNLSSLWRLNIANVRSSWRRLGLWHCKLKTPQK